ncbi:MAG: DUF3298 and DUF4163 domain-containing protein [Tannerella sp.]|nr:DUF3298 and DUF4163 domain-containing protein [Tannerella sp.]
MRKILFMFRAAFAGSLIAAMFCCSGGSGQPTANRIAFDSIAVDTTMHFIINVDTTYNTLKFTFVYPVSAENSATLDNLKVQFVSSFFGEEYATLTPQNAAREFTDDHFMVHAEEWAENHEAYEDMDYSESTSETFLGNAVKYNSDGIISVVFQRYSYTFGAAHGGSFFLGAVFDAATGSQIEENDVFIDDYHDELARIIVEQLLESHNADTESTPGETDFFDLSEIRPNKNFYVDNEGITYIYNEYEIAPYAYGAISVMVPFEKVRHLLRPESVISKIALR